MKTKIIITVLLVVFILASCAPAATVVPTETAVPTVTPVPPTSVPSPTAVKTFEEQVASAEYATPTLYDDIIGQYAQAYGVDRANVQLHVELRTANDRNPLAFQADANGVPLFMLKSGKWGVVTMKDLASLNGIKIGMGVNGGENNTILSSEYSIITPSPSIYKENNGISWYKDLAKFADDNGIDLYGPHLYWHQHFNEFPDLDYLKKADAKTVEDWMRQRAYDIFTSGTGVDFINVDNEAIYEDGGSIGWEVSPMYNAFGKDWLKKAWHIIYEEAQKAGVDPNKLTFMFNDYNNEWPNLKSEFYYNFAKKLQTELKTEGINVEHPIGIGMQFHIREGSQDTITWWGPDASQLTYEGLLAHFKHMGEVGPISITELSARGPNNALLSPEEEGRLYRMVIKAAIDSGKVQNIIFWDEDNNQTLFDVRATGTRYLPYFEVEKALFEGRK